MAGKPWTVESIAQAMREVGTWILAYASPRDGVDAPSDERATSEARKLLENINVLRNLLGKHPVGDMQQCAEAAFTFTERQLKRVAYPDDLIRQLYAEMEETAPEGAQINYWLDEQDAEECRAALHNAADQIEAVGVTAARDWIRHSDATKVFRINGAQLTLLCNAGTVRCVGRGKDRKIDANSLARYLLLKESREDEPETVEDITRKVRRHVTD